MSEKEQKAVDLMDVGRKLVGHSKAAEFTANRGLVIELFPFIFEASERMSARAISRYLLEEQKIKLSAVTITKALNDPKKSWLSFFDSIETAAVTIAKWHKIPSFKYLWLKKAAFEEHLAPATRNLIGRAAVTLLKPALLHAHDIMLEKWFSIGMATRLKAQPYLEEHLMGLEDKSS
jgi:hypothetical protein